MKKFIFFLGLLTIFFSACKKEEKSPFDQTPDERINATLNEYATLLTGAPNGWLGYLTNDSGRAGTYTFFFKFNDANRVIMLSDFDSLSAVTPKESSYRLKALQQPSLLFDTYSYLHVLSDPDPRNSGGTVGGGLFSDFEFYFDSSDANNIKLVGRLHGSKLTLVKATADQETALNNGGLAAGLNLNRLLTYFKRLTIGSQKFDVRLDPVNRQVIIISVDGSGNATVYTTGYYSTAGGVIFTDPITIGSQIINGFDNITYDAATQTVSLTAGGATGNLTETRLPLKTDVTAPRRWWQFAITNGNTYWISFTGFHVNGIDDAFNVSSLKSGTDSYYFLLYWPAYGSGYDLFAPIFINADFTALSLIYGTAPQTPTFTSDGRAVFSEFGTFGDYPTAGPASLSRQLLYSASGFYFVQTSPTSYDMVSAADGKAWISWTF